MLNKIKVSEMPSTVEDGGYVLVSQEINGVWESRKALIDAKANSEVHDFRIMDNSDFVDSRLSFSRASDAYAWDGTQYKKFGPNEPRLVDDGLLMEGQSTNYASLQNINTTSTVNVTHGYPSCIEGQVASLFEQATNNKWGFISTCVINKVESVEKRYTFKVIFERILSNPLSVQINVYSLSQTTGYGSRVITDSNKESYYNNFGYVMDSKILTNIGPNGGELIETSFSVKVPESFIGPMNFLLYPHYDVNNLGKKIYVHHIQVEESREVEENNVFSSPIVNTTNTPVTRAAETLNISTTNISPFTERAWGVKLKGTQPKNNSSFLIGHVSSNYETNGGVVYKGFDENHSYKTVLKDTDGVSVEYNNLSDSITEKHDATIVNSLTNTSSTWAFNYTIKDKVFPDDIKWNGDAITWAGDNLIWGIDNTDSIDITGFNTVFDKITINGDINGHVNMVKIIPKALTDQEIKGIL